jgi:outer membrane protein OmpA-like peptidoglycan-associated protein
VAEQYRRGFGRIDVIGHSDTAEGDGLVLSLRRANAVKSSLVAAGVPDLAIRVIGKGSGSLLVSTPDKVREPQNRRVEMALFE